VGGTRGPVFSHVSGPFWEKRDGSGGRNRWKKVVRTRSKSSMGRAVVERIREKKRKSPVEGGGCGHQELEIP